MENCDTFPLFCMKIFGNSRISEARKVSFYESFSDVWKKFPIENPFVHKLFRDPELVKH